MSIGSYLSGISAPSEDHVKQAEQLAAEDNFRNLLKYFGEDPNREGLKETPKRYVKAMKELINPEPFNFTSFDAEGSDEMVVQTNIPLFSLCEHHTLPFFGTAHVAYIPDGKIVGLSKLARAVKYCSSAFQNQERITSQVAEMIQKELNPKGVAVVITARHMCMEMRGCKTSGAATTTSKMLGEFKNKDVQKEFYTHIYNNK